MSDTDPRYEEAAQADYLSALIDQERLEHATEVERLRLENDELRAQIAAHEKVCAEMRALLVRYRTETPLGHQPHMIAHVVDELLDAKQPDGRSA